MTLNLWKRFDDHIKLRGCVELDWLNLHEHCTSTEITELSHHRAAAFIERINVSGDIKGEDAN